MSDLTAEKCNDERLYARLHDVRAAAMSNEAGDETQPDLVLLYKNIGALALDCLREFDRLIARVTELEQQNTFLLEANQINCGKASEAVYRAMELERLLDQRTVHEPNDSAAEPIDAETIIHNFEHSVRADERNSDKYTKEYVAESRDELKVALSTTQPPQAAEPDEAIASLAAMCGWAELLAELGGWTRANAASFWYAYDAARKLAPTKISPVISPPPVAEHTPQPPNDELVAAARAVVARWETPAWKVAPATAGYIYALRDALDRYAHQAPAAARNHVAWLIESIDNGKAYWWRGSDFTDDANEAVRFSRREDADQVILERGMDDSFSAEHMWCDVPSPTKETSR
jgi:hypothetical protein